MKNTQLLQWKTILPDISMGTINVNCILFLKLDQYIEWKHFGCIQAQTGQGEPFDI